MIERLTENDAIGAIEQCVSSCKSLNFGDSVVMETFMNRLCNIDGYEFNKCIELPDGSVVNIKDAIKWMNDQEGTVTEEEYTEETQDEETVDTEDDLF